MRYVIYGAGAIGGAVGARLFEAGHEVVLIARGRHYDILRSEGLTYRDPTGGRVLRIDVADQPGSVSWGAGDVAVLAMKSQDTEEAVRSLAETASQSTPIVCAQNGVDNERVALRRFPHVYGMCVMMPAAHLDPGVVEAESHPVVGVLDLGRYPSGVDETATAIATDLSGSGFRSQADPAIMPWKYEKLLVNLGTQVRALCGPEALTTGPSSGLWALLEGQLRAEALACYEREGISLPSPEEREARWAGALIRRPVPGSRALAGSGWQSLSRQTGTSEADYVNGEITLLGRLHGVPTPANDLVVRLANEAARLRRLPGAVSLTEIAETLGLG
jgi:2-dehydropantoate 2-reductase